MMVDNDRVKMTKRDNVTGPDDATGIIWALSTFFKITINYEQFLPYDFSHFNFLRAFQAYYFNKFIDYHTNKITF